MWGSGWFRASARCAGALDAVNRLTNSIAVLSTISLGGWLAVTGKLTVGFIYTAFTYSFQLAIGFSNLVTMTGAPLCTLPCDSIHQSHWVAISNHPGRHLLC